jgi:hypothetical protein
MPKRSALLLLKRISNQAAVLTILLLVACSPLGDLTPPVSTVVPSTGALPTQTSVAQVTSPAQPTPMPTTELPATTIPTGTRNQETPTLSRPTSPAPTADDVSQPVTLVGAGDIATCEGKEDEKTAKLLDGIEGTVFTLGDNVYDAGTTSQYKECYEPTWGRHKARTKPAAGNHEYRTDEAAPYFRYFGDVAGKPGEGYYSYELGAWHIVVLNSNCKYVGGCDSGSPQDRWLQADLSAHQALCTLAYWHHPRFSSGNYKNDTMMQPIWETLYANGVDVVMSGHDHNYQRYALLAPDGSPDPLHGIRQFVVGTGGKNHYKIKNPPPTLQKYNDNTSGVLKLTLKSDSYEWDFIPIEGGKFQDPGRDKCH